jgi:general secretion pathway protein A
MYHSFYQLREPAFELTPDPKYLFLTPRHREALSNLEYGLVGSKPVTLLIGEAGTGKTTLLHTALRSDRCKHVQCVYLNNPTLTRDEFIYILARRFDIALADAPLKAGFLDALERVLRERQSRGQVTALVVDEAQRLTTEILEEIRLLGNMETDSEKLLPIILAGQPELATRLDEPVLRQFKQRVALRCQITPFDLPETAEYIAYRVKMAGGIPLRLFTREAVVLIHEASRGIPRTVNVICDNALVTGMALGRATVDRAMIADVCSDFSLRQPHPAPPPESSAHRTAEPRLGTRSEESARQLDASDTRPKYQTRTSSGSHPGVDPRRAEER